MRLWRPKSPVQTVRNFIEAMNARDFRAVAALLDKNFELIDNSGSVVRGADGALDLLQRVAALAPDYRLHASALVPRGDEVLITGHAESTSDFLATSTQWRARADNHRMFEWQSYSHRLSPSLLTIVTRTEEANGVEDTRQAEDETQLV